MIDMHVHLERVEYTFEWIDKFVDQAVKMGIDTMCLVEHTHQFKEFAPMYKGVVEYSQFQHEWYYKKKLRNLSEYTDFISVLRRRDYPVKLLFGLEVCYFEGMECLIDKYIHSFDFDHIIGSVHWLDNFGFDLNREAWKNVDVNWAYKCHFDVMEKLIECELFDVVGHPDSLKLYGHLPTYDMKPTYEKIASLMKKHNIAAEQNGGVHMKQPQIEIGMAKDFLAAVKKHNVKIITSSDAHRPEDVGRNIADLVKTL